MKIKFSTPMTLHAFNIKHNIAEISQAWKNGYEVVYADGTTSWCPKDIYELSNLAPNEKNDNPLPVTLA